MSIEYRVVRFDRTQIPSGQTEPEAVEGLLNSRAREGWELFQFDDTPDGHFRDFTFQRRTLV